MLRHAPIVALLLAAPPALSEEPRDEVPGWADDWRATWLDAKKNGSLRLSGQLTTSALAPGRSELFAILEVKSIDFPQDERPAFNAAVVIDASASMRGGRLAVLKKAAADVISVLTPKDTLALVRFNDDADVLPSMSGTPENKKKMLAFVEETVGQGSSDLSAGLADAYEQVAAHKAGYDYHRVILVSDGRPNKGMADPDGLADIARKLREGEQIHTCTLTIGAESDRQLLWGIAREGWGFTGDLEDASQVFRLGRRVEVDLMRRAAEKAELTVRLSPQVSLVDLLEYAGTVEGDTVHIPLHELAQNESLQVILRLSAVGGAPSEKPLPVLKAELHYKDALVDRDRDASLALEARVAKDARKASDAVDSKALLTAAHAVASRAIAQAQDRFAEDDPAHAKELLSSTLAFLQRTSAESGIVTEDEEKAVEEASSRLFPPEKKPSRAGKKHKGKRR